ncbi:MAG TPA: DUF4239 domain-containing protein [Kofleriaceae bacterium]|nr:DUF4239 domain-containing protein [Kofleriaceae bacterium]
MTRRPLSRTLLALMPPVLLSIGLAEAGLVATRELLPPGVLDQSSGPVGDYLQTLGTVYAVLLAFVVFVVWSQFNDARGYVEREANDLVDLYRSARSLPAGSRGRVQQRLSDYVDGVLEREWAAMACGDERAFEELSQLLDNLWDDLHAAEPETECERAVHADMLARFNELSDARTNRLTSAMLKIPLAMNLLLYAGAVIVVGSMYLFGVERAWIHAILTGALAGALSHVLYLIHDLDSCFSGDWQVPLSAFQRVQRYIRGHTGGHPVCS